jgi:serine/threonine protein kinase
MKTLCKHLILEGENVGYVRSERDVLIECQSNPFIIQLHYAFQNSERIFFLMEVARAGSLYDLLELQAPRPFKQERIIFYIGQISCAFLFLHSKRIVCHFQRKYIFQSHLLNRFIEI